MIERIHARLLDLLLQTLDRAMVILTRYRARISHMDLGTVAEAPERKSEMVSKIRLLIRLRWAVDALVPVVLLVLAAQGLTLTTRRPPPTGMLDYLLALWPNLTLAAVALAINAAYRVFLRKRANLRPIAYAQVWLDIVIFGLMIYATGGIISPFTFLFTVPVLAAGLLLSFRASVAAAAFAVFVVGVTAALQHAGILPVRSYFAQLAPLMEAGASVAGLVTMNAVLYFLIAFAGGALSRTIHQHEETLTRRANQATMLYEVSSSLQGSHHLDEVLNQIMGILVRRLNIDRALMYLVSAAEDALDLKVVCFHPALKDPPRDDLRVHFDLKREAGLTAICALDKQAFNVTDPLNHPLINRELARRIGLNPFALAPMLARGKVIGVIGIDRKFHGAIITHEEAQILAVAANQAGLTILNAELYEKFEARTV